MAKPKINIEKENLDHILEVIAFIGLIFLIAFPIIYFGKLPDKIPSHFNISGQPDDYQGKGMIWLLPAIGVFIYIMFSIIEKIPHSFNYAVKITEENAEKQYRIALRLFRSLKAIILISFAYLVWSSIQIALKNATGLGAGFTPIFLILILGTVAYGFIFSTKNK